MHLLTGLVTCGRCKAPMASKPDRNGFRYVCSVRKGHENACQSIAINGAQTDALISATVVYTLDTDAAYGERDKACRSTTRRRDTLAQIDEDLVGLAADFGEGRITRAEWDAARVPLEARRVEAVDARTTGRTNTIVTKLAGSRNVGKAWEALDVTEQRSVLRSMIKTSIVISPAVLGRKYDGTRVHPDWWK